MAYNRFSLPKGVSESIKNKPQYQNWFKNLSFTTLYQNQKKLQFQECLVKSMLFEKNLNGANPM